MPKGTPGKTMIERPCPECGTMFSVPKGQERNKQYCSKECGHANKIRNQVRRAPRNCAQCGKQFEALPSSKKKTCSPKCAGLHKRRQVVRYCRVCEAQFSVFQASPVRCCSAECAVKAASGPRATRKTVVCPTCNKPFRVLASRADAKYCSKKCHYSSDEFKRVRSENVTGANNPMYTGTGRKAISSAGRQYRRGSPEKELAKSAKRRAAKRNAAVAWANQSKVEAIYAKAKELSDQLGEPFHVDHIVPITSDLVCGLHWEGNLQILRGFDNLSKGNKTWPDMP